MATLLLSDLHLPDSPSPLREAFIAFLKGPARSADAVYILGDLFNYWIDDDLGIEIYPAEVAALRELRDHGVPIYFMGGNRDFIIGERFFSTTGVEPLADPTLIDLGGHLTLLSHGDRYCTDDVALQRWRRFSSWKLPQRVWHQLPLTTRRRIALWLRGRSATKKHTPDYVTRIADVNEAAIAQAFTDSGAQRLIHGHTHRPFDHRLRIDGRDCERIVLGDWHGRDGEYLECDRAGLRRIHVEVVESSAQ